MQAAYITGLPLRMGTALAAIFKRDGYTKHERKLHIIAEIQNDKDAIPLDSTTQDSLFNAADRAARECYRLCSALVTTDAIIDEIRSQCVLRRVPCPVGDAPMEIIKRGLDRAWWLRQIRNEYARRFEHMAIRLGFTGLKSGAYICHESAAWQAQRNRDNAKLLASMTVVNENGQEYTVADLAALGTANKAIRRGELMARIRGFEEIAQDMGHVGIFATITCPSKFHSVGGTNEKYQDKTPRQAQAYLVKLWSYIRSALHRQGVRAYGFRIAEPHTDGCPHWHMLLFVAPENLELYEATIKKYALEEDAGEWKEEENRCKIIRIEAGKGTAAGYIAKYVAKNIDGEHVGEHKAFEEGRTFIIAQDEFGRETFTPSQRVTYWSQLHGIRQFQQIGGAPVGVWRELRRIKYESVREAPEAVRAAHMAVQKIESKDPSVAKQADYAAYCRAQGGVLCGRNYIVRIAKRLTLIEGRYTTREEGKPCGVYHASFPNAVYESVRYVWTKKQVGAAFDLPWTGVNNCTDKPKKAHWERVKYEKKSSIDWSINRNYEETKLRPDAKELSSFIAHKKERINVHLMQLQYKYRD